MAIWKLTTTKLSLIWKVLPCSAPIGKSTITSATEEEKVTRPRVLHRANPYTPTKSIPMRQRTLNSISRLLI